VTIQSDVSYTWIDNDRDLEDFFERAHGVSHYFLDTEFHREKTYFPQLALIQISTGDEVFLVDPF
jgi:ribonuclease D